MILTKNEGNKLSSWHLGSGACIFCAATEGHDECVCQKTREGCGCPKFLAGKVFRQISTLLEDNSPIFWQREMLSLPRFGHFPARRTAAGKLAAPAGTLLDFLLRDLHSLLEFF